MEIEKKKRNSNIELLRIFLTIFVITLHFLNPEIGGGINLLQKKNQLFYFSFIDAFNSCAVDCFILISGYFLAYNNKINFTKILKLYFMILFCNLTNYFNLIFILNEAKFGKGIIFCFIPTNYFFIYYVILYILSPFITALNNSLSKRSLLFFLIIICSIFVIYENIVDLFVELTNYDILSISPITVNGGANGYNLVNFFICFYIGCYIRINNIKVNRWISMVCYLISTILITITKLKVTSFATYNSIFVIFNAVCLFNFFNSFNFNSKIANFVSSGAFFIFCFHTRESVILIWNKYVINQFRIIDNYIYLINMINMIISVMILFCCSFIIYLIYRVIELKLLKVRKIELTIE